MNSEQPREGAQSSGTNDETGGLDIGVDPGSADLGDDVYRDETNRGSVLGGDRAPGGAGALDPGNTDLGDDVYRGTTNRGSDVGASTPTLDGIFDPRNADLGDDADREAFNR